MRDICEYMLEVVPVLGNNSAENKTVRFYLGGSESILRYRVNN